jgi:hypothetical protein
LVFLASCSTLPFFKKRTSKKRTSITRTAHAAPTIHNVPVNPDISDIEKIFGSVGKIPEMGSTAQTDKNSLRKYTAEFIAALLWMLLFYWLQQAKFQRRRHFKLDDEELNAKKFLFREGNKKIMISSFV